MNTLFSTGRLGAALVSPAVIAAPCGGGSGGGIVRVAYRSEDPTDRPSAERLHQAIRDLER